MVGLPPPAQARDDDKIERYVDTVMTTAGYAPLHSSLCICHVGRQCGFTILCTLRCVVLCSIVLLMRSAMSFEAKNVHVCWRLTLVETISLFEWASENNPIPDLAGPFSRRWDSQVSLASAWERP